MMVCFDVQVVRTTLHQTRKILHISGATEFASSEALRLKLIGDLRVLYPSQPDAIMEHLVRTWYEKEGSVR